MATKPAARVIDGRYQLGRVIGRGGMATIHQAFDLRLERPVAVKLLRPEVVRDADLAGRFRREALAATVLRHPNIVACLDTGTADGQPYLVMDLIDGEDLAARLKRGGRLAAAAAARIGLDVARALGAAHLRGIVHRDVKPGNILLAPDGRAMITDFGIARLAADAEAARSGTTLGSVHYFSPEQARGAPTSPASDIYGLGLVLYEALTGTRPFGGESTDAIALARIDAEPPSPKAIRPEVPSELDAVVQRALAPHPDDRYANGAAMAAALEPVVQHLSDASITTTVATPIVAGEPAPAAARSTRATPRRSKTESAAGAGGSRSGVAVALVALLGITGGAIVVAALPGTERPVGSSAASQALVVPPDPSPTPEPTPEPTPTPDATPEPTPEPSPEAPTVPPGRVADLCEVFFDIPCGLVAGRYAPSRFEPAFDIQLGDGWSSVVHRNDLVSLAREEGSVTFAGPIREVYPNGESDEVRSRARDLIRAFIATEGVGATSPATVRIGGRRGLSTDLAPSEHERVALFSTESSTYHLEPERITRIVVMDLRGGRTILIAIESRGDHDLRDILDTADPAAGTIRWR